LCHFLSRHLACSRLRCVTNLGHGPKLALLYPIFGDTSRERHTNEHYSNSPSHARTHIQYNTHALARGLTCRSGTAFCTPETFRVPQARASAAPTETSPIPAWNKDATHINGHSGRMDRRHRQLEFYFHGRFATRCHAKRRSLVRCGKATADQDGLDLV